ncbi:MAG: 5-formyltetrahydrofolate cyclo-ligase [Verrucomicrobiaceae bacterium]|nr:MAG: 5-formyltetrahydrofolate cyclo-ligase [Verrucomicrobiaceae bacterium]
MRHPAPHLAGMVTTNPHKLAKQSLRNTLRHQRFVIPSDLVSTTRFKAINHLRTLIAEVTPTVVSLYSAREGELDLTPLAQDLWQSGQTVALPRVVARGHPLTFNIWPEGTPLEPDALGIPAATGAEILPAMIVLPMLGYSRQGYRLGSGGGYFDRTIKNFQFPVTTVGISFTELEIPEFPAESHDIPLNFIVTGKEVITCR